MKKNQIIIIALILITAAAGYVGYMKISLNNDETAETELNPGEAVITSFIVGNVDFATEMKLAKTRVRETNKETLMCIINSQI